MKKLITLLFLISAISLIGQRRIIKDDPIQRHVFEIMKFKNPVSGRIPANIRTRELEFTSGIKARGRTEEASTEWTHRGPFNVGGRTRALAVSSIDENLILAGGVSGGVWRSTDQGATWTKVSSTSDLLSITCIAQDIRGGETDTWYYGTGEWRGNSASGDGAPFRGDGIYKSTDNGLTWSVLPATVSATPQTFDFNSFDYNHEIVVNPSNGHVFVANYFGIQRSQDGGDSFSEVLTNSNGQWTDIATTSSGVLFAAIDGTGIFKSIDNGDNWTEISNGAGIPFSDGDRIELAVVPSNEDILYVLGEANTRDMSGTITAENHMLWKFDDNGDTWVDLSANIPVNDPDNSEGFDSQRGYNLLVKANTVDFVVIGGTNLYRSTDGFTTNSNISEIGGYRPNSPSFELYPTHHPDQHAFIFLSGDKALSGNDGGLQITNDITDATDDTSNGITGDVVDWIWLNNGYLTTQVYALSVGPGDQIMSGFQDNSTWLSTDASSTSLWSDQFSGDGAYNAFNSDGTVRYMSAQNASIDRVGYADANDDTPDSFTAIDPTVGGYFTSLFITPFYLDLVDDEILYLGGDINLFVNTQASTSTQTTGWKSIILGNSDVISEFGLTNTNIVYCGTASGELYKVQDPAGATPIVTDISSPLFPTDIGGNPNNDGYISSIGVNLLDENELMVVFSNYEVPSIFHSSDGGATWTDVGGNLEQNTDGTGNGPSVRAARIIGDGFEYYVGTSTGLYSTKTLDAENTVWVQEGSSLIGNVVVNHIVTRDDGQIAIGTHGNGLYSAVVPFGWDLTVSSLDSPESMPLSGLTDVIATLTNEGGLPATSFDISLTIDSDPIVTDNVVATIDAGETHQHTFTTQFDFSTLGDYEIEIVVSTSGDTDPSNDTFLETIKSEAAPTDIDLSNSSIAEEKDSGTVVGSLSSVDEDDMEHTYSLVDGEGDDDNASFSINSTDLVSAEVFDFETKTTYLIRVETADDDGNTFAKSFSIEVTDVLGIDSENAGITMYPNPFSDQLNLEMVNEYIGIIEIGIFSLDGKQVIFERSYDKQQQRTTSLLDLTAIPDGSYIVKFSLGDREISSKLIKERSKK